MTINANIYTSLIIYSAIAGVFLSIIRDILNIIKEQLLSIVPIIQNTVSAGHKTSHTTVNDNRLLLKNNATASSLINILYPKEKASKFIAAIIVDVIFSLICAITVTLLIFGLNYGETRWFVLPITAAGYFLYRVTLSRPLHTILNRVISQILKLSARIVYVTLRPGIKLTEKVINKVLRAVKNKKNKKNKTFFQKPLDKHKKILYNIEVTNAEEQYRKVKRKARRDG